MRLPQPIRQQTEATLSTYCLTKVPPEISDKLRIGYSIRGSSVTLLEERPSYRDPEVWIRIPIAKFRYEPEGGKWTLFWSDRNSKWHEYSGFVGCRDFDVLLEEVEKDPTGIFWG